MPAKHSHLRNAMKGVKMRSVVKARTVLLLAGLLLTPLAGTGCANRMHDENLRRGGKHVRAGGEAAEGARRAAQRA